MDYFYWLELLLPPGIPSIVSFIIGALAWKKISISHKLKAIELRTRVAEYHHKLTGASGDWGMHHICGRGIADKNRPLIEFEKTLNAALKNKSTKRIT